jgi:hypothetical protein
MFKKILVIILILACLLQPSPAFAHGGHGGGHGWGHGGWGWGGWGWGWGAVGLVETAALVNAAYPYAPYYYVNGVPYYYGNPYYAAAPAGYVGVAQSPVAYVPASAPASAVPSQQPVAASVNDSFDIHIPNGNGSFTLVTLQKTEKGFLGPQGEFYADHPTEDQLKSRYCKN